MVETMPPPPDSNIMARVTGGMGGICFCRPFGLGPRGACDLAVGRMKARVGHAQRPGDVLAHEGGQRLAADHSTTRPSTSVDMPYSQVSPGWATERQLREPGDRTTHW